MSHLTVKNLVLGLLGVSLGFWAICVPIIDFLPAYEPISVDLFRVLNPAAIAIGISAIITYWSVIKDMIKNWTAPVTGSQLLIAGGVINWVGIIMRRIVWYILGASPPGGPMSEITNTLVAPRLWVDNAGLWISILGGILLIAAVDFTYPDQDFKNIKRTAIIVGLGVAFVLIFIEFSGILGH